MYMYVTSFTIILNANTTLEIVVLQFVFSKIQRELKNNNGGGLDIYIHAIVLHKREHGAPYKSAKKRGAWC